MVALTFLLVVVVVHVSQPYEVVEDAATDLEVVEEVVQGPHEEVVVEDAATDLVVVAEGVVVEEVQGPHVELVVLAAAGVLDVVVEEEAGHGLHVPVLLSAATDDAKAAMTAEENFMLMDE